MFNKEGESSKHRESLWRVSNLSNQEVDMVNQHIFENAKRQNSTITISEIKDASSEPGDNNTTLRNNVEQPLKVPVIFSEKKGKKEGQVTGSRRIWWGI